MTRSGWYPDPTGRFPRRWHDGHDWTASVVDADDQQGYDALPAAAAPAVPALPGPSSSPMPPPPPSSVPPPPNQPAASPSWQSDSSWAPGQPWQSGASGPVPTPAQQHQHPSHGDAAWQPGPSVASEFSTTSAPTRQRRNPVALIVAGAAAGLGAASLFVLDWADSLTYADLQSLVTDRDVSGAADNVLKVHMSWLGWAWAALAIVGFGVFVVGQVASHRLGHVLAALTAAIGAVLSAFVIVRLFRGPGPGPEFGAWLLPAGYLVLLAATVVSAQREPS